MVIVRAAGIGERAGHSAGIKTERRRRARASAPEPPRVTWRPMLHSDRLAGRDLGPVHKGAVFRSQVFQQESIAALREAAVVGGNGSFWHHQIAVDAPSD